MPYWTGTRILIDGLRIPRCFADQPPNGLTICACHCCGDAIAGGCCCLALHVTLARAFDLQLKQNVCGMPWVAHIPWPPSSHDRHTACRVPGHQPCAKASATSTDVGRPNTLRQCNHSTVARRQQTLTPCDARVTCRRQGAAARRRDKAAAAGCCRLPPAPNDARRTRQYSWRQPTLKESHAPHTGSVGWRRLASAAATRWRRAADIMGSSVQIRHQGPPVHAGVGPRRIVVVQ